MVESLGLAQRGRALLDFSLQIDVEVLKLPGHLVELVCQASDLVARPDARPRRQISLSHADHRFRDVPQGRHEEADGARRPEEHQEHQRRGDEHHLMDTAPRPGEQDVFLVAHGRPPLGLSLVLEVPAAMGDPDQLRRGRGKS